MEETRSDMMDISNLRSPLPISSTSALLSSSSMSNRHPLLVGTTSWQIGERTTKQILSVIQPTIESENRRMEIIEYLQGLIGDAFGIKVYLCGSVPLKTYLPHGDVDLTAVSQFETTNDLASQICSFLQYQANNPFFPIKDVLSVPAKVRVVKCTVGDIAVDISFNLTSGLSTLYFLEQVDQFVGKDHLFKLSIILIKAWCYYESRLLGGFYGLISTYALETMVLHVINIFHSSLNCPLAVLYKFLEYYSTFDWDKYCIAFNGLVLISALPEIDVVLLHDCNKLLLTEEFLRSAREVLLPPAGVVETKNLFPVKFLNILDPLRDDNNLGRSVSKGNRYRIKSALSYGFQRLSDILILPPEELRAGLERFFNNTLERNGKGKRVDVLIPVPPYGSESSVTKNDNIDVLSGIKYGLWLNDYAMKSYPVWPAMSVPGQIWNTGRGELGLNIQYDQNPYCYVDESLSCSVDSAQVLVNQTVEEKWKLRKKPFSTDSPRAPQLNNLNINDKGKARGMFEEKWESRCLQLNNDACFEERRKLRSTPFAYNSRAFWQTNAGSQHDKWRSRGTVASVDHHYGPLLSNSVSGSSGTCVFIPLRENLIFDEDEVKQEIGKSLAKANEEESEILGSLASTPKESSISSDIGERSCSIKYSMNEFPLLHGSKPIPIRSPPLAYLKDDQVKETSVSFDSTEFGSCKPSSPASLSFSEAGKQSDSSDVSVFLDALSELTSTVRISEEDIVSLKSEENKVVSVESLPLTDESEFPPLACPPKPVIPLCKKEFPPLRACLRSQKKKKNKGRK